MFFLLDIPNTDDEMLTYDIRDDTVDIIDTTMINK